MSENNLNNAAQDSKPSPIDIALVRWTKWVGVFTALLVICSGISDYFIFQQLKEMKSSGVQLDKQIEINNKLVGSNIQLSIAAASQVDAMKSIAEASKIQANAIKKSNEIANNMLEVTNRPYVNVTRVVIDSLEVNQPFKIKPIYSNSGKTPARNLRFQSGWQPNDNFDILKDTAVSKGGTQTILPNGVEHYMYVEPIPAQAMTKEMVAGLLNGSIKARFVGRIDYLDAFNKPHVTAFCKYFDSTIKEFIDCATGNTEP